jgi:hypothetical protein
MTTIRLVDYQQLIGKCRKPGEPRPPSTPRPEPLTEEQLKAKQQERSDTQGRFAWDKLHSYRGCDPQWLDIWQYIIPQRCDCKDGYQRILADMPPDFTSPEAFFAWGVALHNAVNKKLSKPEITIEKAYFIWRKTDGLDQQEDIEERS